MTTHKNSRFTSFLPSFKSSLFSRPSLTTPSIMLKELFDEDKHDIQINIKFNDTMPVPFTIDGGTLYTHNKDKDVCTSLIFNSFTLPDALYLEYYYYGLTPSTRKTCAEIDHDTYFNIVDFFSFFFKKQIQLKDTSIKLINECKFTKNVMFLIKEKTFYERFQFHNVSMNKQLKTMITGKFVNDPQLNELNDIVIESQLTKEQLEILQQYIDKIGNQKATLSDVANWLYLLCVFNHAIINTNEFIQFIVKFNNLIQLPNQPEFNDIYIRETSTIPYTFDLEKNGNNYLLRIRSPVTSTSAEETKSSGGNLKKNKQTKNNIKIKTNRNTKRKTKRKPINLLR
jgi:hypothetical protein